MKFPKILAFCVIRSRIRKRYDGGIYLVDLENKTSEQKLDWNLNTVEFPEHLGDIGLRHGVYWNNNLYCSSSQEILVFNDKFELIKKYTHPYLRGTHQLCTRNNKLYTIANQYDSILELDLTKEEFTLGFQFNAKNHHLDIFNPQKDKIEASDTAHLDMISIREDFLYFSGSQSRPLIGINLDNYSLDIHTINVVSKFGGTHNAQLYKNGIVYTLSDEGQVCFQRNEQTKIWNTPLTQNIQWTVPSDFAKPRYSRGMVLTDKYIIVGSSPARVDVYDLDYDNEILSVEISNNVANSVCGLCEYKW